MQPFQVYNNKTKMFHWILFVDPATDRFLTADENSNFIWLEARDCILHALHTPAQPTTVVLTSANGEPIHALPVVAYQ